MDARNRNLSQWFTRVRTGQLQLPRFQRFEAWGTRQVAELVQTMIDRLPAGAVLVLEVGDKSPFHHRPLVGVEPTERMTELLLDGQQRLTAATRALLDDYPDHTYFIDIRQVDIDEDGSTDYRVVPQGRWWRKNPKDPGPPLRFPLWCDDPRQVLGRELIPLKLLAPDDESLWKHWLQAATEGDPARYTALIETIMDLRSRIAHFNLPYLALPVESSEAVVLNVFVKLNTSATPLTAFDIVVARVEQEAGSSLHDLVAALEGQVPGLARYIAPEDVVLQAAALLQGKRPTQREFVFMDFERMISDWPRIVAGAERTVEFLVQNRLPDGARLPTEVILAPLMALWAHATKGPDHEGFARTLLTRYAWRAFATSRYEVAAATSVFQDYQGLLPALQAGDPDRITAPIFSLPLPVVEELLISGWPKRRERLARAILASSFQDGAHDIADGAELTPMSAPKREYHHLFPVAFLKDGGVPEADTFRALNCALISWRTNRTISAKAPVDYLRERANAAALGEAEVRQRLATHGIDYDRLAAGDYESFLRDRAESVLGRLQQLTGASSPSTTEASAPN